MLEERPQSNPLLIRSDLDLSGVETQRRENLATNFVGNIAEVIIQSAIRRLQAS
jgi:hypothetical protein